MFITEPETNVIINIDTVCNTVMRMSAQLRNVRVGVKVPVILGRSHPPHRQDLPPGGDPPLLKTVNVPRSENAVPFLRAKTGDNLHVCLDCACTEAIISL